MDEKDLEKEVMWNKGTELPFLGKYVHTKDEGMYVCKGCGTELFKSDAKFESGTGWPSLYCINSVCLDLVDTKSDKV